MQSNALVEILRGCSPDLIISDEVLNEIQLCVISFVEEIGKGLTQKCEENTKDTAELEDLNSLFEGWRDDKEKTKFSENVPLPSKFFLQYSQINPRFSGASLYKRNNGHSAYVRDWIAENAKSHLLVAVVGQAMLLKRVIEAIKENSGFGEINMECDAKGMQTQALGNSNVSVFHLELLGVGFEFYSCNDNFTLGISLMGLLGFLKQAIKGDQLTILYANGFRECVFVLEDGVRSSVFEMRLKEMDKPAFVLSEEMEYPTEWNMSPAVLQRICKDMKASVSDVSVIVTETGNLSFVGSGHYGRIQMVCDNGVEMKKISPCVLSFSSAYLSNFSKACGLANSVKIKIGADLPLSASFDLAGMLGHVKYFLAYRQV